MTACHLPNPEPQTLSLTVALAGNPNVGKSTLFNSLTGARQKIANYPGVTVEKKTGRLVLENGTSLSVIDLPGTYSLKANSEDENIASKVICGQMPNTPCPNIIIVIAEATKLERGLYLLQQIRKIHANVIFVVNMMDELKGLGLKLDLKKLERLVQVPVVACTATLGKGLKELKESILDLAKAPRFSEPQDHALPFQLNESDAMIRLAELADELLVKVSDKPETLSDKIDKILLHSLLGPVIFLSVMLLLFQSLFSWAVPVMDLIDTGIGGLAGLASGFIGNEILNSLVTNGIIAGVGSVVVFVPQIALTFLFIGFLEMTGYLARGGFLIDRIMRMVGLEGRAFVPLISSFACAIPGILAARTLPNARHRLTTILIAPLMTCSARLPVYTLMIAAFVPASAKILGFPAQGMTLFFLFLLGIVMGMIVAFVFNRFGHSKASSHFIMELPPYRLPKIRNLYYYVSFRLRAFLKTAGTIIFILSLLLWALAYFPHPQETSAKYDLKRQALQTSTQLTENDITDGLDDLNHQESGEFLRDSYMGRLGKTLEPAFSPLGFDWRITIGVLTSFAAREVFVSTMGIVFNLGEVDETSEGLVARLNGARRENGKPLYTLATAMALLVFFALASQCISTLAVIRRETNSWKWPAVSFTYMTVLAYVSAALVYQTVELFLN